MNERCIACTGKLESICTATRQVARDGMERIMGLDPDMRERATDVIASAVANRFGKAGCAFQNLS